MERLLKGLLRSLGGSEANLLEVCFGRIPSGNFHTKATSKKSRPPSENFRPNPPELPRSPSRSFSSHEAGWKIILECAKASHSQSPMSFCRNCPLNFARNFRRRWRLSSQCLISGCCKRRSAKGVRSFFSFLGLKRSPFWSLFLMLLSLFSSLPNSFCRTPFAVG